MARNTEIVTITAEGRDKGKTFFITEFPPRKAEAWAVRALTAIARSGKDGLDPETVEAIKNSGMAAMAALGLRAITSMSYDDAMPLLDEMLEAVKIAPDVTRIDKSTGHPFCRPINDDDIEEVGTLLYLRDEVFKLHTGFSVAAYLSELGSAAKEAMTSPTIPTSPALSETSST